MDMAILYDNHRVVILSLAGNVQKLVIFGGKCPEKILFGKKGEY